MFSDCFACLCRLMLILAIVPRVERGTTPRDMPVSLLLCGGAARMFDTRLTDLRGLVLRPD